MPRDQRGLRILMILESEYSPRGGGGAESQVRTLAHHLQALGHQVTVVTPQPRSGEARDERIDGVAVTRLRYPRIRKLGGVLMNLRLAAFLVKNRDRYDAWHVHIGHNLGAVTCLLGDLVNRPVVLKISGWWELEKGLLAPRPSMPARIARSWLKRASSVQAISTRIAEELAGRGFPRDRIVVLPNAVDVERFVSRDAPRSRTGPFTAVYVGRLSEEKGLSTLLDGWARAFPGRTDVRLQIVGDGPIDSELRARAAELGIAAEIDFLGPRDDVERVLAGADIGVLPSRIEGLSNALLELMACGLPTIASRVSGSEDFVIAGRNGWLFPASDADALARTLREAEALPTDELAALGKRARADVIECASLDRVVGRLVELYQGRSA
jgi:L-malate glycosyltransferase